MVIPVKCGWIRYSGRCMACAIKRPDGRVFFDEDIYNSEEEYLAEVIRRRANKQAPGQVKTPAG